jgi:hypothetical protein
MLLQLKLWMSAVKNLLKNKINPAYLQWAGLIGIVAAYVIFGLKQTYTAWAVMATVGVDEVLLIWVWDRTITAFVRSLAPKTIDLCILFGLIPLTWWWFNPQSAGFLLVGLLLDHFTEVQPKQVVSIKDTITLILERMVLMSQELLELTAQVEATKGAMQSAKVLIEGLAAKIIAAADDPAALKALADSLKTETDVLSAAVAANPV